MPHSVLAATPPRRRADRARPGRGPALVWFCGLKSDMGGAKAEALDAWAAADGRAFVRFDYSGHGASDGRFEDGTVSRWLEDAMAVLAVHAPGPAIFVGSSMGGWIATLAALALRRDGPARAPAGLVLVAPALDFTERLMWDRLDAAARRTLETEGGVDRPSAYGPEPYRITRDLIVDGRRHLLLGGEIDPGCPVHILQGMRDDDVPWSHAIETVDAMPSTSVQLTLVKDGDHRLSRPEDLALLVRVVAAVEAAATAAAATAAVDARAAAPPVSSG